MGKDGYKLIALGIAITHKERMEHIAELNEYIEQIASAIRSSSDADGMPHAQNVSDPVSSRAVRMEMVAEERDREQERVNAVEWAKEYVSGFYSDENAPIICEAIMIFISGDRDKALAMVDATGVTQFSFHKSKSVFLRQILKYLRINRHE